jgi:hypothetical protein
VNTYPIINEAKTKELNTRIIQDTLYNNKCNKNVSIRHSKNQTQQKYMPTIPSNKTSPVYVLQKRDKENNKTF